MADMSDPESDRIVFKFNSGLGAIVCSGCSKTLKTGLEFTAQELASIRGEIGLLPAQYCSACQSIQKSVIWKN